MSFFGDIFQYQNRRIFPKLNPANGPAYIWNTFSGELVGSYGPFGEVYATYVDQPSDNLEDLDWASFPPPWDVSNKYFPVILGIELSKAKSFDNTCKSRFNKIPLHITTDKAEAYAIGLIPGATYELNPGLDIIHFNVNPSSDPYELSFVDRHQVPMCIEDPVRHEVHWGSLYPIVVGGDAPAPPSYAVADDAGNVYTFRWMKDVLPAIWQWQRIEIRKFDSGGNEVWRNVETNNNISPLGCGLPAPGYYGYGPSESGWEGYADPPPVYTDNMDLGALTFRLLFFLSQPYILCGRYVETEHLIGGTPQEQVWFEWEFSHDANFATIEASGLALGGVAYANGYYSGVGQVNGALFGSLPWSPLGENGQIFYTRMRMTDGGNVSVWRICEGIYGTASSGDIRYAVVGPDASDELSGQLPSGYRWVGGLIGQMQIVGSELLLSTVGISYHYTEGVIDLNGSTPIVYRAVMIYHFSTANGTFVSVELLTAPTTTDNGNIPTSCQTEVSDGKLYVYWGILWHDNASYYAVDIRAVAGTWIHVEWVSPLTTTVTGKLIIDNEQAMILVVNGDIYVMTFDETGYQVLETITGETCNLRNIYNYWGPLYTQVFGSGNFALSIDHQKFYVARYQSMTYQGGAFAIPSYVCLPGIRPPIIHSFPLELLRSKMCKVEEVV